MILYFTGTGNSRHIAVKLSEATGDCDKTDIGDMIKKGEKGSFYSEKPYIFVVPTYGWRIPRIVSAFIADSDFGGSRKAYFIMTCGDSSGNAGNYAKKLCDSKGFKFMGCADVKMPENYIAVFSAPDEETSEKITSQGEREAERLGKLIAKGLPVPSKSSFAGAMESVVVNPIFYALIVKAKGFRSTDRCIGCGLCEDVCVMNNITMRDGRPEWGDKCTHCMACICRCPEEAIEYKRRSEGKRRYYLAD